MLLTALILTFLTVIPKYTVELHQDIPYAQKMGYWCESQVRDDKVLEQAVKLIKLPDEKMLTLRLDIYRPHEISVRTPLPMILFVHGGTYFTNSKNSQPAYQLCRDLASQGYITVSIDYRLGFALTRESIDQAETNAVDDTKSALDFLLTHARAYGIDPKKVFLAGSSSGAMTVLRLASRNERCRLLGIIDMWGAVQQLDMLDGCEAALLAIHGDKDEIVPFAEGYTMGGKKFGDYVYGSQPLVQHLNSLGKDAKLVVLEGYGHAPYRDQDHNLTSNYYLILDEILDFLKKMITL